MDTSWLMRSTRDLPDVPGIRATSAAARRRLLEVCDELAISADHLAALIAHESGWRPDATNPHSGATGLIQFMPATARSLGTTVEALRAMSAAEQLEYVRAYFARAPRPLAPRDVAMAAFLPSAIGRPDDAVLFSSGSKGYEQNRALDADRDGQITAGEVRARIDSILAAAAHRPRVPVGEDEPPSSSPPSPPPPTRPEGGGGGGWFRPLLAAVGGFVLLGALGGSR